MTAKKTDQDPGPAKKDGRRGPPGAAAGAKLTAKKKGPSKYTLWQSKDDIAKIDKVRKYLEHEYPYKSYRAKSKIYQDLPDLYLNAVKRNRDLQLAIDELTAEVATLNELRSSVCRIIDICKVKK